MAGKKLYSGEIYQAMIDKLDQSITSMNGLNATMIDKMNQLNTTMIDKLTQTISSLNAVNTSVSQGIVAMNVKPGSERVITFAHGEKTRNGGGMTLASVLSFRSFCNGVIEVRVKLKTTKVNYGLLAYSINGGGYVNACIGLTPANVWIDRTFNIPVNAGDVITFAMAQEDSSTTVSLADGTRIAYSVVNLGTEDTFYLV